MPSMIELLLRPQGLQPEQASPLEALGSRFGISQQQTQMALEALAPALSIGMKRNVSSPMGAGALIEALASGRHRQFADQPGVATSDIGLEEGNKILGHVLGTKDVSRAVAAQASQSTGIGSSILKQMLPMIASMVMGAMFKGATGENGTGGILEKIMGQLMGSDTMPTAGPERRIEDGENPLGRIFEDMLKGRTRSTRPRQRRTTDEGILEQVFEDTIDSGTRSSRTRPAGQIENILGDMFDGMFDDAEVKNEASGQRQTTSSGRLTDIFGDMLDSGRPADDTYQNELEQIFDRFKQ